MLIQKTESIVIMLKNELARTLLSVIKNLLRYLGVKNSILDKLDELIFLIVIVIIAFVIGAIVRLLALYFLRRFLRYRKLSFIKAMIDNHVISQSANPIPPLIISGLLPFAFYNSSTLYILTEKLTIIYFLVILIILAKRIGKSAVDVLKREDEWQNKPIKGFVEIIDILFIFIITIIIISLIFNKTPMTLITGLSAFAAIILLIFKGIIVGFVSGVLLSENDMVHIGDWIELPNSIVNGVVIEISLTTVKIENFDNSIVTVPPETLISAPLINWRAMQESGGRRIMFSYNIRVDSIKECTHEFLIKMKRFNKRLSAYIDKKMEEKRAGIEKNTDNTDLQNGTIDTNLGLFRAYMLIYIEDNVNINKEQLYMIRTLAPTTQGLPLQLYCFSANTNWVSFESIQSEIMEHFVSVLPKFELYPFQEFDGKDIINYVKKWAETGKN